MNDPLVALVRALRFDTASVRFTCELDKSGFEMARANGGKFPRFGIFWPQRKYRTDYFRDDVACFSNDNSVAGTNILEFHLLAIVQCCHRHS